MIAFIRFDPSTHIFYVQIGEQHGATSTLEVAAAVAVKHGVDSIELDYDSNWPMSQADAIHTTVWAIADIARELPPAAERHLRQQLAYPLQDKWLKTQPDTPWTRQLRTALSQNRHWYAAA